MKFRHIIILLVALVVTACHSNKSTLGYFENVDTNVEIPLTNYEVKIVPDDELLITVNSLVPEATAEYNLPLSNPASRSNVMTATQPRQMTYIVDKTGDINVPGVGEIHVAGMTTENLAALLTKKIGENVKDPYVKVQLVNFRVNILGEVTRPGTVEVKSERFSILDALAAAGDLTPYGERENILLIRENDGKRFVYALNINDANLLSSPYFYLQQNDVIYVKPNSIRSDNAKYNQNNAYKLSIVSAIVSACSVVVSLCIALIAN